MKSVIKYALILLLVACKATPCIECYGYSHYISGRVVTKYCDLNDPRHYICIVIKIKGEELNYTTYNRDSIGIYQVVQAGDSVVKLAKSSIFCIIRPDTTFYYDIAKDCKRIDKYLDAQ